MDHEVDAAPERDLTPAAGSSLVVGHDGSESAGDALAMALELAAALSAPIVLVRAWAIDTAPKGALFHDGYVSPFTEVSERVRQSLVEHARPRVEKHPEVEVEYRGVLGDATEVLLTISATARMLVVGSRGRGGFAALMLGSTSEQCVRHADCPVLVVRRRAPGDPA
jgi:nucleotide-binding universal stress UspA family protein